MLAGGVGLQRRAGVGHDDLAVRAGVEVQRGGDLVLSNGRCLHLDVIGQRPDALVAQLGQHGGE